MTHWITEGIDGVDPMPAGESAPWCWLFADIAGVEVPGPAVAFRSQESAETWLTDNFSELSDAGITAATLLDGEHVVYGPMSLSP